MYFCPSKHYRICNIDGGNEAKDEKEDRNEKLLSLFNTRKLRCPAF